MRCEGKPGCLALAFGGSVVEGESRRGEDEAIWDERRFFVTQFSGEAVGVSRAVFGGASPGTAATIDDFCEPDGDKLSTRNADEG